MTRKHYNDGFEGPPLEAGITWFDPGQSIDARSDETEGLGPKGESDGALQAQAPNTLSPSIPTTIGERQAIAEAIRKAKIEANKTYGVAWHHLEEISRVELIIAALATSTTNAPVAAQREAIARMLDELRFGYSSEQTLGDVFCDGIEATPNDDIAADTYEARQTLINGILALRQTIPIHGEMREALRQAITLIDEINERKPSRIFWGIGQSLHAKLCTIRATLARNALQGDGL